MGEDLWIQIHHIFWIVLECFGDIESFERFMMVHEGFWSVVLWQCCSRISRSSFTSRHRPAHQAIASCCQRFEERQRTIHAPGMDTTGRLLEVSKRNSSEPSKKERTGEVRVPATRKMRDALL